MTQMYECEDGFVGSLHQVIEHNIYLGLKKISFEKIKNYARDLLAAKDLSGWNTKSNLSKALREAGSKKATLNDKLGLLREIASTEYLRVYCAEDEDNDVKKETKKLRKKYDLPCL